MRRHAGGVSLAIAAPCDQLFLATEVNEWAACPELAPAIEESAAFERFTDLQSREARPDMRALIEVAESRKLPHVLDESALTLGSGTGCRSFGLDALPTVSDVPWNQLHTIPTALVTGSNGKTTTVRLLAACATANEWRVGYNCTDGVFVDGEQLASGDYSGPDGARTVLRDRRTQAAVIETARGGILRRGIAVSQADTAVVTNVSSDHFGEYGIDDLNGLAEVKLTVAAVVSRSGLLVLNADDALLRAKAGEIERRFGRCPPLGWFALDAEQALLREHRCTDGSTCGVRGGHLMLTHGGIEHDLGLVSAMPLSIDGIATYNVANLAGAALAAIALGIPAATVRRVFAEFGGSLNDNPGRMMRFDFNGARVLVDYAHNPDGLRGLLAVARRLCGGTGRLGLLLGHAGNRKNADIEELARVAAAFRPDFVVVKEDEAYLRGRPLGEIPRILRAELRRSGLPESAITLRDSELEAVRCALDWARPGDVLALTVHSAATRAAVMEMMGNQSVNHLPALPPNEG